MAMEYTNTACATVKKKRLSNVFFGFVLSRKFSPVNFDTNIPRYTILPVAINNNHTWPVGDKKSPPMPTISQAINPAIGVAISFFLLKSSFCSSSVLFGGVIWCEVAYCVQHSSPLRCGGIPCSVSLNLLLKFNSITIAQHLFINHHIAKLMLSAVLYSVPNTFPLNVCVQQSQ